jgi:hypothetical protein
MHHPKIRMAPAIVRRHMLDALAHAMAIGNLASVYCIARMLARYAFDESPILLPMQDAPARRGYFMRYRRPIVVNLDAYIAGEMTLAEVVASMGEA